jgi:hypothetical protein
MRSSLALVKAWQLSEKWRRHRGKLVSYDALYRRQIHGVGAHSGTVAALARPSTNTGFRPRRKWVQKWVHTKGPPSLFRLGGPRCLACTSHSFGGGGGI